MGFEFNLKVNYIIMRNNMGVTYLCLIDCMKNYISGKGRIKNQSLCLAILLLLCNSSTIKVEYNVILYHP